MIERAAVGTPRGMKTRLVVAIALLSGTGCTMLGPDVAEGADWDEGGTTDDTDSTTSSGTSGGPGDSTSTGQSGTDDTAEPPPEDECWELEELVVDPSRSPPRGLAVLQDALVMAGSPSYDGVGQIALDGSPTWSYGSFVPADLGLSLLDVAPRDDGSFVIAGQVYAPEHPSRRGLWIAALGPDGSLAWQEVLGSIHYMVSVDLDLRVHPAGGLIISAHDSLADGNDPSLLTIRIDDAGEVMWSLERELPNNPPIAINWAMGAMDLLPNGDIVQLTSAVEGLRVVRTTADGDEVWDQTYATATWPQDIVALPDGDILVLSMDENDADLVRLDGDGAVAWEQRHRSGAGSNFSAMAWDPLSERLLAVGTTRGTDDPNDTSERTWAAVLDGDGVMHWSHVGEPGTPSFTLDLVRDPAATRFYFSEHGLSLYLGTVEPCPE